MLCDLSLLQGARHGVAGKKKAGGKKQPAQSERLWPTPSTLKKLFAYSGNQCAMPDCKRTLVHSTGTMVGKVAHIHAAEPGGARYDADLSQEARRAFENLFIVCGEHHDVIDDKKNEKLFPADLLRKYKEAHEKRFRTAERQLIEQFQDTSQTFQPTYPTNLRRLATVTKNEEIADHEDDIEGVREFVNKLKELPLEQRQFAIKLAERMRRLDNEKPLAKDIMAAFNLGATALKRQMDILEMHNLGFIEEGEYRDMHVVRLCGREPGGNPWFEVLEFCEKTEHGADELLIELNFGIFDE